MKACAGWCRILPFLVSVALAACSPPGPQAASLQEQSIENPGSRLVRIDIDRGAVRIAGTPDDAVKVSAQLRYPADSDYDVAESPDEIRVHARAPKRALRSPEEPPIVVEVLVPSGTPVVVEAFDGLVELDSLDGRVEVDSASADIRAADLHGTALLRTGRGDTTVQTSSGDIRLIGEHGVLSVENSSGNIAATTIMGTVRFTGRLGAADIVDLETDHGPVEVYLETGSSAAVHIASTSGRIVCTVPGLSGSIEACSGALGDAGGVLTIRTVSGAVALRPAP